MPYPNYTLSELQQIEGLSVRACNVCERYGMTDLFGIIEYFNKHKSFLGLHNSGKRTDQELTLLCKFYIDVNLSHEGEEGEDTVPRFPFLQPLTSTQIRALDDFTQSKFTQLSKRAQNCLAVSVNENISFTSLYQSFIEDKTRIEIDLPNSGAKTNQEIILFLNEIQEKYQFLLNLCDEAFQMEAFKIWLSLEFQVSASEFQPFEQEFLKKRFPLFRFIDFLFRKGKIIPERSALIFEKRSGYFKGIAPEMLDDLAQTFDLTRERVRQIAEVASKKFEESIFRLASQKDLLRSITSYSWNYEADLLYTTTNYADELNREEGINFQPALFTKILRMLLGSSHHLFEAEKKAIRPDFLIKKELVELFDFDRFFKDVVGQLEGNISREYKLSFEGYLVSFLKYNMFELIPRLSQVCQTILMWEFSDRLAFDLSGDLIIHRNSTGKIVDYIVDVLNAEKRPMNIFEIHERIASMHPDLIGNIDNLRSHIGRGKDIFIYFGRSSTYGLREWEDNIEGVKGGTIRSIVEEYLERYDEPKHISEILGYVLKYRPNTNEISIMGNLKLEPNNKFIDFGGSFWGLREKIYGKGELNFRNIPPVFNRRAFALLKKTGGMHIDQLIEKICQSLYLRPVQVKYQLGKLIQSGKLSRSEDGIIVLPQDN